MTQRNNIDLKYKYYESYRILGLTGAITLWKTNNRLSTLRIIQFLTKFLLDISLKNIQIINRAKKIKNYIIIKFCCEQNMTLLEYLAHKLPEAEFFLVENGINLLFNFYKFRIEIFLKLNDSVELMKITQLFREDATLYKNI